MRLVESRFININVIDMPTEGEIFPWIASGSGTTGSGYTFSFPGTAEVGQYAIGFMAMQNTDTDQIQDIFTISGISASRAFGLSSGQKFFSTGMYVSSPFSRKNVLIQPLIFYIQAGNIGNSYTVNWSSGSGAVYDTVSKYAYIIVGVNPNYYSSGTGYANTGVVIGGVNYPTLATSGFSYQSQYPAIQIIATAGYPNAVSSENLHAESFLSVGYNFLSGGSSAVSRTISQDLGQLLVQMLTPRRFV